MKCLVFKVIREIQVKARLFPTTRLVKKKKKTLVSTVVKGVEYGPLNRRKQFYYAI